MVRRADHPAAVVVGGVVETESSKDQVGFGWRPALATELFNRLEHFDFFEIVAENFFAAPRLQLNAMRALGRHMPLVVHGVGLGLASTIPVDEKRLKKMARLVDYIQPVFWSEHLAFVRAGGIEIGHLAAPPRSPQSVAGTIRNLERARKVVGSLPVMENIATLIDPPGSTISETSWITQIMIGSGCELLLDLHNLYANAQNFGFDAIDFLKQIPLEKIRCIHISGGQWIALDDERWPNERRLLDDHRHDVPKAVLVLLEEVAARARSPLTVILERDGDFPVIESILAQISQARVALARGRARQTKSMEAA